MARLTQQRFTLAVRILLAASFVAAGGAKLAALPQMVAVFDQIGVGQWFRVVTGLVELAGGLALWIRPLRSLAALGLAATMLAAVGIHLLKIGGNPAPAAALLVLCGWLAWQQRQEPGGILTVLAARPGGDA